jgi:glutathione S-transferase
MKETTCMSGIKIYGVPQSRASRCLWMARELGIAVENVPVHFSAPRDSPALLAVNPNARIPALDDNGFHLYESMAINLYLAKKYGSGTEIAPGSLEQEALCFQWSLWVMTEVEKPLLVFLLHAFGRPAVDDATLAQNRQTLDRPLAVLDAHLSGRDWLVADHFTVADLNVASVLAWTRPAQYDLGAYPRAAAWLDRCLGRPAAPNQGTNP